MAKLKKQRAEEMKQELEKKFESKFLANIDKNKIIKVNDENQIVDPLDKIRNVDSSVEYANKMLEINENKAKATELKEQKAEKVEIKQAEPLPTMLDMDQEDWDSTPEEENE